MPRAIGNAQVLRSRGSRGQRGGVLGLGSAGFRRKSRPIFRETVVSHSCRQAASSSLAIRPTMPFPVGNRPPPGETLSPARSGGALRATCPRCS
ncbi:unnamed protein product [Pylaiella littoralis]